MGILNILLTLYMRRKYVKREILVKYLTQKRRRETRDCVRRLILGSLGEGFRLDEEKKIRIMDQSGLHF